MAAFTSSGRLIGMVCGGSASGGVGSEESGSAYYRVKGTIESLAGALGCGPIEFRPLNHPLLSSARSAEAFLGGERLGYLGETNAAAAKQFSLRSAAAVGEIRLDVLCRTANLVPQYVEPSSKPAISRDINFIVRDEVRWADLASAVRNAGGNLLERLDYVETFRDEKRDGPGRKRILIALSFRPADRTLTSEEADSLRDAIVAACRSSLGAEARDVSADHR